MPATPTVVATGWAAGEVTCNGVIPDELTAEDVAVRDIIGAEVTAGADVVTCCRVDETSVAVTGTRAHWLAAVIVYPVLQGPSQVPGPRALHTDDGAQFTSHAAQPNTCRSQGGSRTKTTKTNAYITNLRWRISYRGTMSDKMSLETQNSHDPDSINV